MRVQQQQDWRVVKNFGSIGLRHYMVRSQLHGIFFNRYSNRTADQNPTRQSPTISFETFCFSVLLYKVSLLVSQFHIDRVARMLASIFSQLTTIFQSMKFFDISAIQFFMQWKRRNPSQQFQLLTGLNLDI